MPTYLVTGSNRGIGLELCRQIHKRGDNVIATCRKASKELRDLGVRVEENVEISSDESITNLCKKLSGVNLDCLIHNAGIYEFNSFENLDKKSIFDLFDYLTIKKLFRSIGWIKLLNFIFLNFYFSSFIFFGHYFSDK